MDNKTRQSLIESLSKDLPRYASNFGAEFVTGKSQILYSGPYWDHRELEMAMQALLTGAWLVSGEYVVRFQNEFSRKFGVKYSHMVNSGSSANLVMLAAVKKCMKWADGDEVVVSPVGFPTTVAPVIQNGLTPVFVDIETDTLNFDVSKVSEKITDRTVAIFVSPVLGNPPDMDELVAICRKHEILLLGDNCDSLGSRWNGELLSKLYYAWTTSFYPSHHITTGEGGMICSDDPEIITTARSISWWGRDCYCVGQANTLSCGTCGIRFSRWLSDVDAIIDHKYLFTNVGYNLKPLDLQGAIGLAQLGKVDEIEVKRRTNKAAISKIFENHPHIRTASQHLQADPCWFGVPLICDTVAFKERFVAHLEANKIQTRGYFAGNLLSHPGYSHLGNAPDFPQANTVLGTVFFLGCPPHYTGEIIEYIRKVVEDFGDNN